MKTIVKRGIAVVIIIIFAYIGILVFQGYQLYHEAITETSVTEKLATIQQQDEYVRVDELPQIYKDSVLVIEDRRFYEHNGIDILAIIRALFNDIIALSPVEGGSTITQQLAKNEFFTQDKEVTRKIAEVFMAYEIEKHFSKDEIFELYVNSIYFGEGYYGIAQASMGYYDIEPYEMDDYQSTLLAGVPNAPSVYAPTVNPELAAQRQRQVLNKLLKYNIITPEKAEEILSEGQKRYAY